MVKDLLALAFLMVALVAGVCVITAGLLTSHDEPAVGQYHASH